MVSDNHLHNVEATKSSTAPSLLGRVLLRFVYAYILLYSVYGFAKASAFALVPLFHGNIRNVDAVLKIPVPWVAVHLLRFNQPLEFSRAGDSTYSWVEHFLFLLVALLATLIWSALDRKRAHYRVFDAWLRLFVRLSLAFLMFVYGFDKFFPLQFHSIDRPALVEQLGNMDHFRLMWQFMAASKAYTFFSGLLEIGSGVLLLIPSLANLGALACAVVMVNVVALNLAYNIPVKLFSTNILLMAIFLAAPLVRKLMDVLVFNRATSPTQIAFLSSRKSMDRTVYAIQIVCGFGLFFLVFFEQRARYDRVLRAQSAVVPMQGIWQVDTFVAPDTPLFTPALSAQMHLGPGEDRWQRIIFDQRNQLVIQLLDGELDYLDLALSKDGTHADITDAGDTNWQATLTFDHPQPDRLHLHGLVNGSPVDATLHRLDESHFAIKDEGLHLINRAPRF